MMQQRTLNIIYICKGHTKYWENAKTYYDAIRNYMSDECMCDTKDYTEEDISNILYEAMRDYIDHCNKPSFFMFCIKDVVGRHNCDICHAIPIVFNAYTQVRDDNGNYVNGFDDRLHKLEEE